MMKKTRNFVMLLVVCLLLIGMLPTVAFAKGSPRPYKDVSSRNVDAKSLDAIIYVKNYGGWTGIAKRGRFYPNRPMTRYEFLVVLHNLYGGYVTADIGDMLNARTIVTANYCCQKMASMSKALGYGITWTGDASKMKRKDVARYIKIFATFNPKLAPRK